MKISNCKELNPFDHFEILERIENKRLNKMLKEIDNKTCKLISKCKDEYIIIHNSSKKDNIIQVSYFYKNNVIGDYEYNNIITALKNNLRFRKVIEVIV